MRLFWKREGSIIQHAIDSFLFDSMALLMMLKKMS